MQFYVIQSTNDSGKKVYITHSSYNGVPKLGTNADPMMAVHIPVDGANAMNDTIKMVDRVFRNLKTLKLNEDSKLEIKIMSIDFDDIDWDDPEWQNMLRKSAIGKLNPLEIKILGAETHAIAVKLGRE